MFLSYKSCKTKPNKQINKNLLTKSSLLVENHHHATMRSLGVREHQSCSELGTLPPLMSCLALTSENSRTHVKNRPNGFVTPFPINTDFFHCPVLWDSSQELCDVLEVANYKDRQEITLKYILKYMKTNNPSLK